MPGVHSLCGLPSPRAWNKSNRKHKWGYMNRMLKRTWKQPHKSLLPNLFFFLLLQNLCQTSWTNWDNLDHQKQLLLTKTEPHSLIMDRTTKLAGIRHCCDRIRKAANNKEVGIMAVSQQRHKLRLVAQKWPVCIARSLHKEKSYRNVFCSLSKS